ALPVDSKAPGRARHEWFANAAAPARENLWASFPRPRRLPFIAPKRDEYAERLRSLGYLTGQSRVASSPGKGGAPGWTATGWLNLGNYWNEQGKRSEAIDAFRHALVLWPGYAAAEVNLIGDLVNLGRRQEAVAEARKALEVESEERPWAVYEIAARLESKGWL